MNPVSNLYITLGGIAVVGHLPLPPGLKGYLIIGSPFYMPHEKAWLKYDKWFEIYGMAS